MESVSESIDKQFPDAAAKILKDIKPEDNDAIIIAGADTALKAKRGAFAAAWVLVDAAEKV
jgi:hypothetical protein